MPNDSEVVEIDKSRYKYLLESEAMLQALRSAGVDNWGGYSFAIDLYEEMEVDENAE